MITKEELAKMIDHTNLSPEATESDIEKTCQEAIDCNFGQVCVRPEMVKTAREYLRKRYNGRGYPINVVSVIGFPYKKAANYPDMADELRIYTPDIKAIQAINAIEDGAREIDMIINFEKFHAKKYSEVAEDILIVVSAAGKAGIKKGIKEIPVKVILETCFMPKPTEAQILFVSKLAEDAGGTAYIKTSTGFGPEGANIRDVSNMSYILKMNTGIKASGGISTLEQAFAFYEASQKFNSHPFRIGASKLVNFYKNQTAQEIKDNY